MLKDVIKIFDQQYEKNGEGFITDSYIPADGEYIIVDTYENNFNILDRVNIKFDKKTQEVDRTSAYFKFIQKADCMSKLLDMNKPIDPKKVIHSNNYLTFFIKKENINNGKLNEEIIDKYYEILKNPLIKYNSKAKAKKLYEEVEKRNGKPDNELIDKIENWIKENIHQFVTVDNKEKTYLKIFFKYDLNLYTRESEKYILTNLYNSNDYNIEIDKEIYGLPNDNMGLNAKKPYLEHKTRKVKVPYLLSEKEVLLQKKFFDYLMNQACIRKTNIYFAKDEIKALTNDKMLEKDFTGYFLRIKKGKEVEIHDCDNIVSYSNNIKPLLIQDVVHQNKSKLEYVTIHKLEGLRNLINEVFYSKFLNSNYFTDPKDININDAILKRNLLLARNALFTRFYKGSYNNIWKILNFCSLDLIKGSIRNGYILKASDQFNLRCSLKNYYEGGEMMADVIKEIKISLRDKINQKNTGSIDNDKQYYFAVGQLTSYFISLSKTKKKVHSFINPIVNAKSDIRIKDELRKLYKKYNYAIEFNGKRLKNLYGMVVSYVPKNKIDEDLIIAGYLHSNLIFEKSTKDEEGAE